MIREPLIPQPHAGLMTVPAADHALPAEALAHPLPGNYGVSHGSGVVGELIRSATQSWAGHAFVYVGNGMIIEAAPPATRIAPAASHPDAVWNTGEPLTGEQRSAIVARAHALLGTPYDYRAYIAFAMMCLHIRTGTELSPLFTRDADRVCSADVADEYKFAGIDVTASMVSQYGHLLAVNLVPPSLLYDRIAQSAWAHS
jgi:hypothetical protein